MFGGVEHVYHTISVTADKLFVFDLLARKLHTAVKTTGEGAFATPTGVHLCLEHNFGHIEVACTTLSLTCRAGSLELLDVDTILGHQFLALVLVKVKVTPLHLHPAMHTVWTKS